jgi:hypothetical protein
MPRISRRSLLAKTGVGAAAAGVVTAVPSLVLSQRHQSAHSTPPAQQAATEARTSTPPKEIPSVAFVRDAAKGEVVLMIGTREVVRTDPALVAYLGRCCDTTTS